MRRLGFVLALGAVSACGEREVILPGEREPVRPGADAAPADVGRAIALPAVVDRTDWTHVSGSPEHWVRHPALAPTLSPLWSARIGQGNDKGHRITAQPVVSGGRIFTLDSRATVTATSTAGATLWSRNLTPPADRADDASGGGLGFGAGRVFVTTGFGELVALDPATGGEFWRQDLDAAASGAPTVRDGIVYVVSRDGRAWAVDAANGRVRWQAPGAPASSGVIGASAPAVDERIAVFPFSSGVLLATFRQGGTTAWTTVVTGRRIGRAYAGVPDITADPVIRDGVVYAGNQAGRVVATSARNGETLWTAREGAVGPVWVSGGSVFLVSDRSELVRLEATTGARIWGVPLPYFTRTRPARQAEIFAHYGPVLAGGRLWVASGDGALRAFAPETGALLGSVPLPGGAATRPAIANRTLYVVSADGRLQAFR